MTTTKRNNNNNGQESCSGVDKGVCTNDVLEDLQRAIKFEAVFSTLIENKILSIKRECEEKRKQKRSLVRFLFGIGRRRNVASIVVEPNIEAFPIESPANGTRRQRCRVEQANERAAEDQGAGNDNVREMTTTTTTACDTTSLNGGKSVECSSLDRGGCCGGGGGSGQPRNPEFEYKYDAISIQSDTCRPATSLCLSNDMMYYTAKPSTRQLPIGMRGMGNQRDKRSQSDDFIARSCPTTRTATRKYANGPTAGGLVLSGVQQETQHQQQQHHPPSGGSQSILTSSSSSNTMNDSQSKLSQGTKVGHNINRNSSGNNNNNNNSVSEAAGRLTPREASVLLEQERNRLRVLEMRSISAQCSPILPRHIEFDSIVSLSNSAPICLHPGTDEVVVLAEEREREEEAESIAVTTEGVVSERNRGISEPTPVKSHRRHTNHKSKSQRAAEYLASQIDFDSLASYPLVNPKTQGIISSFNQLKSPNLPTVIPMRQQQQQQQQPLNGDLSSTAAAVATRGRRAGDHSLAGTQTGGEAQQVVKMPRKGQGRHHAAGDNNELRQSSEWVGWGG